MNCRIAAIIIAAAASAASAQSWEFTFSHETLSPENPSTTVTLWATFSPSDWAFAVGGLNLNSSEIGWSNLQALIPHPGQVPGAIRPDGLGVTGITAGQFWTFGGIIVPDPANPIAVWEATYTATEFASVRDMTISTQTRTFGVWPDSSSVVSEPRVPIDIEATIRVVPAPAPLAARLRRPRRSPPPPMHDSVKG